jgi:hypothetical protein
MDGWMDGFEQSEFNHLASCAAGKKNSKLLKEPEIGGLFFHLSFLFWREASERGRHLSQDLY